MSSNNFSFFFFSTHFMMRFFFSLTVASLLTCLHKLREENLGLEEHIRKLKARRDHLLGVNARLAMPLAPISQRTFVFYILKKCLSMLFQTHSLFFLS